MKVLFGQRALLPGHKAKSQSASGHEEGTRRRDLCGRGACTFE